MDLSSLYQMVGTQPSVQAITQLYPSLMYAFQHPLAAIEGYTNWAATQSTNQEKGENMDYLAMAQKAVNDLMESIRIVNGNIKGLYDELEKINNIQQEILSNQQAILEAAKEVE